MACGTGWNCSTIGGLLFADDLVIQRLINVARANANVVWRSWIRCLSCILFSCAALNIGLSSETRGKALIYKC